MDWTTFKNFRLKEWLDYVLSCKVNGRKWRDMPTDSIYLRETFVNNAMVRDVLNPLKNQQLITINPKPNTDVTLFVKLMEKAMTKKWITKSYWCFEWRNIDEGLHAHAIIQYKTKRPSEIKREFQTTFKNLIGNNKHVNIIKIWNGKELNRCYDYLKGLKKNNFKKNHVNDVRNRKKYNLESIYKHAKT